MHPKTLIASSLLIALAGTAEAAPPPAATAPPTAAAAAAPSGLDACRAVYPVRPSSARTVGPLPRYAASQRALSYDEARFVICALKVAQKECLSEGQKCAALDEVLKQVYPGTYDKRFANLVIYIPREAHGSVGPWEVPPTAPNDAPPANPQAPPPTPLNNLPVPFLFSDGKLSPFFYGSQQISVLVLSEAESAVLDAHATIIKAKLSNPLQALLTLLSITPGTTEEKLTRQDPVRLSLSPFAYNPAGQPMLWTSQKTFDLETDTVARITVLVKSALVTATATTVEAKLDPAFKIEEPAGRLVWFQPCMLPAANPPCDPDPTAAAGTNLQQMTALVSTSSSSRFAFSFAATVTYREDFRSDTGASLGRNAAFGAVVLGKVYALPPRLAIAPDDAGFFHGRYRPSLGLVAGTNVTGGSFHDWIIGVSVGHILDRAGLLIGASWIGFPAAPSTFTGKSTTRTNETTSTTTDETSIKTTTSDTTVEPAWRPKRQWRFIVGIEYTF